MRILLLTFLFLLPLTVCSQQRFLSGESTFIAGSASVVSGNNTISQGVSVIIGFKNGIDLQIQLAKLKSDDDISAKGTGVGITSNYSPYREASGDPFNLSFGFLFTYSDLYIESKSAGINLTISKKLNSTESAFEKVLPAINLSYIPFSQTKTSFRYGTYSLDSFMLVQAGLGFTLNLFSNNLLIFEPALSMNLNDQNLFAGISVAYLIN
ncbi:MAG: hypothetical protein WD016_00350 [Balneolaceae bacterium]